MVFFARASWLPGKNVWKFKTVSILLLISNNSYINVKKRRIQKNTLWCLVELFQSFGTCVRLQTHECRAVRMKKHDHETNISKFNFSNIGGIESD